MKQSVFAFSVFCLVFSAHLSATDSSAHNPDTSAEFQMEKKFLTILRNKETSLEEFQRATKLLGYILATKAGEYIKTTPVTIQTPLKDFQGTDFSGGIVLAIALRAGLSLVEPFRTYFPQARVAMIGLERDEETAIAKTYYYKPPHINPDDTVIFIDPMIATGGSACITINKLIESGAKEENMVVVGIIGATEGVERLKTKFPKINIVIPEVDVELNETKFIVPGLGDFGDRFYGTPVGKSGLVE